MHNLNLGYSEIVTKNNLISTIDTWGPEYRVAISVIVHSAGSEWSNILRFTNTGSDCCNIGDRLLAIFYNSGGFFHISSDVGENGNYVFDYNIELNKEYHIEIVQERTDGKVRKYR